MREPMAKPHTERVLTFVGPKNMARRAIKEMQDLGFKEVDEGGDDTEATPWRELPYYDDPEKLPGMCLSGARYREDLTQVQLATLTGIPRRHISEMENAKRPIGRANAKKLAAALNIDARILLKV